ncbi:MAG: DUF2085 domain-containing protein [Candidatus Micrarchaeota archaeon]
MEITTKKIKLVAYALYVLLLVAFVGAALATPFLAFQSKELAYKSYDMFAPTCHQKLSRSQCIFRDTNGAYSFGDCTPQNGVFVENDGRQITSVRDGTIGYKVPICARDVALYGAMLLAAFIYPFVKKWDDPHVPPAIYFVLAIVPLGIDGAWQLLGTLNLVAPYESTNLIRTITGVIAGVAATWYIIPIIMNLINRD